MSFMMETVFPLDNQLSYEKRLLIKLRFSMVSMVNTINNGSLLARFILS